MLNVDRIRQDFPILSRKVNGKPLVYLDNAATTQKPQVVIDALVDYYERYNANIHRGIHTLSEEATDAVEQARAKVAKFINAPSSSSVIFTRNATEAINLVAYSWGRKNLAAGDEIILSEMEHHSNLVPWQMLAQSTSAKLKFISVTDDGLLDLDHIESLFTPCTKLVSVTQMSNVLGTINPVREIADLAHRKGALVMIDGAQGVPHLGADVQAVASGGFDCDFLAFSAHKMLGPTGIGILYGRQEILEKMDPFLGGGDMILQVWLDRATYNYLPWKFEAGTPNIADAIAFGAAIDYLEKIGMDDIRQHEINLVDYTLKRLREIDDIKIYGPSKAEARGGVVAFNLPQMHPHDLGTILNEEGIAIRAGHHCCQPLMRKLGVTGTARASFHVYNTRAEVDALVSGLHKAQEIFSGVGT